MEQFRKQSIKASAILYTIGKISNLKLNGIYATPHCKGACDGIGGTVKREGTKANVKAATIATF